MAERPYELILLGATGYTGKLTAEYIQEHVATDLKWAIAGRNGQKLHEIAEELKKMNPDRIQPGMRPCFGIFKVSNADNALQLSRLLK
jgi:N-acetyl-gamma-glutamylphosphate reductase